MVCILVDRVRGVFIASLAKYCQELKTGQKQKLFNKSGPNIDPWGTPVSMFSHLLKMLLTFIRGLRFNK